MEDECEEGGNRFGGVEDLSKLSQADLFTYFYYGLSIKAEELEEKNVKNVTYTNKNPAFVVAWLQSYLN